MAEALGVVGSVIGIIQITATVALRLNSLVQGIRDAPDDIRHLQDDVANLAAVLDTTHELSEQYQHVEAPSLTRALKGQLGTCEKSMQDIRTFLDPLVQKALGGNKFIRMVEWNLKKSELRDLRGRLREGKAGLNLTITSLHGYLEGKKLDEIKSDIGQLYEKIMSDFKDIVRGEEFRKQIEKDVDNDSVRDGQSDAGFVMRSFIDQTPGIGYPDQGAGASSTSDTLAGGDDLFNMDNPEAMLDAVRSQNKQYVRALISRGVGLTGRSKQGFTVLHYCAFDNDVAMGQLLIKNGAQLNTKDFHLRSPLRLALSLPSYGFAELLVDSGCDIGDSVEELRQLLAREGEIPGRTGLFQALSRTLNPSDQCSFLHPAIRAGDTKSLQILFNSGFDPKFKDGTGLSLFFYALLHENVPSLRFLSEQGADINEWLPTSTIPKLSPNLPKQQEIQKTLTRGATPLHLTARVMNDAEMIKLLLELGADPNHVLRTSNREIVLIGVCANHFLGVARELLKAGANPNHASNDGRNAMYWALYCGNVELFKLLVQNGGDVNYRWQHDECTLIMMAAERGNMDILRVLMDAGADVGGQNKNGETALGLAQQKNKKQAVELLQKTAQQGAGRDTKGPVTPFRLQGSYTKQATIS
ncbi:Helo-like-N domain-containing protein [Fusarium sp. Ph1]|nr:Helo-like-N domain-containing protein [Fusarium sp. Ph1]